MSTIIIDQHKIAKGKYGDLFCISATVCGLIIADTKKNIDSPPVLIACHLGALDTELTEYEEFCEMLSETQTNRIFIFTQPIPSEEKDFYKSSARKISENCIKTYFYTTKNSNGMIAVQFDYNGNISNLGDSFNNFNYL